jgi:hypothetical protein
VAALAALAAWPAILLAVPSRSMLGPAARSMLPRQAAKSMLGPVARSMLPRLAVVPRVG